MCGSDLKRIWGFFCSGTLTGAVLYGGCPGNGGGSIEGAGEAVGTAMFRLVVISGTRVAGNQTGTGEMTCRTGDCRSGDQKRGAPQKETKKWRNMMEQVKCQNHPKML